MKKIYLIVTLISVVLLLQNCKKDTVTATATSTALLFADINDSTWNPTTIHAAIDYDLNTNSKVLSITGNNGIAQLNVAVLLKNALNSTGFPITTYNVNTAGTVNMSYGVLSAGIYVPQGTVNPGSGTIEITAIDSVKKQITGLFSFTTVQNNYDSSGNIISTQINAISQGTFNGLPYTFTAASN